MDCNICCEKLNKSTRKPVTCGLCQHTACMACTKQYLLQSVHQAHCMSCRKEWTMDMLTDVMPKSFLNEEYRSMRETVLFEEEKTYLPDFLEEAERMKKLDGFNEMIRSIEKSMKDNEDNEDQLVRTQREKNRELVKQRDEVYIKIHVLRNKTQKEEKREVVMKCPIGECRGFLSSKFHCGMCETQVCKDCHLKQDEEHKCNQDDVATVSELKRSTRPCPKCNVRIYKTDGCDQMFCVQCHTAFSWNTGKEEQGVIHNPHYFETLRAGGIHEIRHRQEHGGCGYIPTFYNINKRICVLSRTEQDTVQNIYQQTVHHRQVTLPRLVIRVNRDMDRIKYLMGDMEEKKFKQKLYVHHQSGLRRQEEHRILDSYVTISEELFRELASFKGDILHTQASELLQQLVLLRDLTHKAVNSLDKKFTHKGILSARDIIPL